MISHFFKNLNVNLRIGIRHGTGRSYGAFLYFPYLVLQTGRPYRGYGVLLRYTIISKFFLHECDVRHNLENKLQVANKPNVTSCRLPFQQVFCAKIPVLSANGCNFCCRCNCLLCRLSISHPQSTDRKDSTPCTPASGGQPTRAYMNFHHRTSSFSNQKTPIV